MSCTTTQSIAFAAPRGAGAWCLDVVFSAVITCVRNVFVTLHSSQWRHPCFGMAGTSHYRRVGESGPPSQQSTTAPRRDAAARVSDVLLIRAHRDYSNNFLFTSGRRTQDTISLDWRELKQLSSNARYVRER